MSNGAKEAIAILAAITVSICLIMVTCKFTAPSAQADGTSRCQHDDGTWYSVDAAECPEVPEPVPTPTPQPSSGGTHQPAPVSQHVVVEDTVCSSEIGEFPIPDDYRGVPFGYTYYLNAIGDWYSAALPCNEDERETFIKRAGESLKAQRDLIWFD